MSARTAISNEEREAFHTWTELDDDLQGVSQPLADTIFNARVAFSRGDLSRTAYWKVPEGIDVIPDLQYLDDGTRAHKLDLYLPHDSVVRGGKTTPVYIDIHGGGFIYGHKELNRNFCTNLAAQGFAVFSINYRPAPQTDFIGQLQDVSSAFAWIKANRANYPIAQDQVFVTGDSAGGTLALYSTAIECSASIAKEIGVVPSGLDIAGCTLISPLTDLTPYLAKCVQGAEVDDNAGPTSMVESIAPVFFKSFYERCVEVADLPKLAGNVDFPSMFINTSNDDFIQADSLKLATALVDAGHDVELHAWHTRKGETLGHVFPVCMSWLTESRETLGMIRDFTYSKL